MKGRAPVLVSLEGMGYWGFVYRSGSGPVRTDSSFSA